MGARDEMFSYMVRVNSTSGTGTATGEQSLYGLLMGLYFDFHASADAGSDTTVQIVTPQGVTITVLTLTNINTDGYYVVVREGVGATGTGIGQYFPILLAGGKLKVTIAQDGSTTPARTDAVTVTAFIM